MLLDEGQRPERKTTRGCAGVPVWDDHGLERVGIRLLNDTLWLYSGITLVKLNLSQCTS